MSLQLSLFGVESPWTDGLFFALFPDDGADARISKVADWQRRQHGLKGWPLRKERFHVSLVGIGEFAGLPQRFVSKAIEAAAIVAFAPFDVTFDRVMSFIGTRRPLVLRGGGGLTKLIAFQRVLGDAIQNAGFSRVKSRYVPHVTLLYDNRGVEEQPVEPISWTVREFVLIHSLRGKGQYIPLGRWSLRTDARALMEV